MDDDDHADSCILILFMFLPPYAPLRPGTSQHKPSDHEVGGSLRATAHRRRHCRLATVLLSIVLVQLGLRWRCSGRRFCRCRPCVFRSQSYCDLMKSRSLQPTACIYRMIPRRSHRLISSRCLFLIVFASFDSLSPAFLLFQSNTGAIPISAKPQASVSTPFARLGLHAR